MFCRPFIRVSWKSSARTCLRRSATSGFNGSKKNIPPVLAVGVPVGFVSGMMGALCGVGGGLLIIPVLKTFSKLSMHQITATSLCSISIASIFAAGSYVSQGTADVPVASVLAMSAILSAKAGAKLNHKLPAKTLSRLLGAGMLLAVPLVLLKDGEDSEGERVAALGDEKAPLKSEQTHFFSVG